MISLFYVKNININLSWTIYIQELKRRNLNFLKIYNLTDLVFKDLKEILKNSDYIFFDNSLFAVLFEKKWEYENCIYYKKKETKFYEQCLNYILDSKLPIIYFSGGSDLHWFSISNKYPNFLKNLDVIVWAFDNFKNSFSSVEKRYKDYWMKEDENKTDPMKNWKLVTQNVKKRIDFQHCISEQEILTKNKNYRFWDISIPGVNYKTRMIAKKLVDSSKLKSYPFDFSENIIKKIPRFFKTYSDFKKNLLYIKLRRLNQNFLLRNSKIVYTCGSGLKYPVRKIFEIPAQKAAMILYGNKNYNHLGFEDGINCIFSDPDDVLNNIQFLLKNEKVREKIILKCYELILKKHTLAFRIDTLSICLKKILKNTFHSAKFKNGNYEIL